MEKTIQLDQREQQAAGALAQRTLQAKAQLCDLLLQREQVQKQVDAANEAQGSFFQQILAAHGIERYDGPIRVEQGSITINDTPPQPAPKPNGAVEVTQ